MGGRPLPFSAVEAPSPLPVPGATLQIEVCGLRAISVYRRNLLCSHRPA